MKSCSLVGLIYFIHKKTWKVIRQSQNIMLAYSMRELIIKLLSTHAQNWRDIINNTLGFASSPVSLKWILCARELPGWSEVMNI